MDSKELAAVKAYLFKKKETPQIDGMFNLSMIKGKRAKRTIDAARTSQNYYKTDTVHNELLNHYENVDWYERYSRFDFSSYVEK